MISINNITITQPIKLLKKSNIDIESGKLTLIIGKNGTGKTSLLYEIGLFGKNNNFDYKFNSTKINLTSDVEKAYFRREKISFVFQNYQIIEETTIRECFELMACILNRKITDNQIRELLEIVNLDIPFTKRYQHLSGGQKQRIAIALALVKQPELLILDEPTAHLDENNTKNIMKLLKSIAQQQNIAILISSHDSNLFENADVIYEIKNKKIDLIKGTVIKQKNIDYSIHSFSIYSLFNYVLKRLKKDKIKYLCFSILMGFILSLSAIVLDLKNGYILSNQKEYINILGNEILLTNSQIVSEDIINDIRNIEGVENVSYFTPAIGEIGSSKVVVVPLCNENYMSNKIIKDNKKNTGWIIGETYYLEQNKPNELNIKIKENSYTFEISKTYDYSYNDPFKISGTVIYIDPKLVPELTEPSENIVIKIDDFNAIQTILDYENSGFTINGLILEYLMFEKDLNQFATLGTCLCIVLWGVSLFLLINIYNKSIDLKIKRWTLLRVNGLTLKDISQLLLCNAIIIVSMIFIFSFLWGQINFKIINVLLNTSLKLPLISFISKLGIFSLLIIVIYFGILCLKLKKSNIYIFRQ